MEVATLITELRMGGRGGRVPTCVLGQRNIQMVHGPMILTGYQALNKLLGQQVYTTQDQLGGPHIMVPNGVTHELVRSDQDGVVAILRWLAFVPKTTTSIPRVLMS